MGTNYYDRRNIYTDEQLVDCYLKHHSSSKAGKELGVSYATVLRAVERSGIDADGRKFNGTNQTQRKITDEQILESVKMMTRDEIADKYGVHVENLARRMRKLGVSAVPKQPKQCRPIFGETWHYINSQKEKFEESHHGFEYIESRKIGNTTRVRMKCRTCGTIVERAASTLRQKNIICDKCAEDETKQKSRQTLIGVFMAIAQAKTPKVCAACGEAFYSPYPNKKYCSDTCKKTIKGRYNSIRRRCRKYGVFYDPKVTAKAVIERDGGICQICHKKCDENDRSWGSLGPKFPTVDHIIPLAKGGTHTWGNVQCACALCNSYKRDLTEAKGVS